ncbi:MAG: cystathionine beta-lyase, partial [Actinomycetia bacterium]|nr:cystathionine beta-lyase [Actinomycetes bacterium]
MTDHTHTPARTPARTPDPALDADLARLRALTGVKWNRYGDDVLPCWVADMDMPTAPSVTSALRHLVDRADFGYNFGALAELPEVWAQWQVSRHGWTPEPSRVRVLCDVL